MLPLRAVQIAMTLCALRSAFTFLAPVFGRERSGEQERLVFECSRKNQGKNDVCRGSATLLVLLGVSTVSCNLDPSAIASQVMCDAPICRWRRTA